MSVTSRRWRSVAAAALTVGLALGMAACSKKDDDNGGGSGATDGPVTLTVQFFGSPGLEEAVKAYQAAHPNVKVDLQNKGQLKDFAPQLQQYLAAGKGAGDIVMLEEGNIGGYLQEPDGFANLLDLGADKIKDQYAAYKWGGALTPDGKKLIGLGTDVGPLALAYRVDLFQQAGLPTDRTEVSKLWATWDDYVATGKKFQEKVKTAKWLDSATSVVQPYVMQNADTWFYSKDNKFIGDTNPAVKQAWDLGLGLAADGLTAKLKRWDPTWDAAFKAGAFATVPAPPWYTGVIKERAGDGAKGKWDIATIPGKGGNWGGSYLGIPKQSKHQAQAFELLKYLTGKEGEVAQYKAVGALPSNLDALQDPAVADSTNDYFNNAPFGKIYGGAVKDLKPIYLGPKHQQLWENVFEPQMQAAETGKSTSQAAWDKAVKDGKALAAG
jgi:cellobiose transport system substrate-binding protein